MGNGHAPGTEIGLGAAGADTTATGVGAGRSWKAGLAVFFFAAFFIAGSIAGFFLAAVVLLVLLTGLAGFVRAAALALAAVFFLAGLRWTAALPARVLATALRLVADLRRAFFAGLPLRTVFFFAERFFTDFFLLAIRTSLC
jgi:hypothetical protein